MTGSTAADLEAEYNNRARVPEYPAIMAGWENDALAYREARAGSAELGIPYGPHTRQRLDLFHADQAAAEAPLVVFIHGGYWRSLDPSSFSHLAAGANTHGLHVAMPGYRLCPEVRIADIIADLRQACRILFRRFKRPIVACGHSAGGHLAAALAATDWAGLDPALPRDLVRRGLAISGIFDLAPLLHTTVNESLRLDEAAAAAASPVHWPVPPGVRFDAWVGGLESAEYFRQSRDLVRRWAAAGAGTNFAEIAGANHFTAPAPLADPGSAMTLRLVELCAGAAGDLDRTALLP